MQLKSEFLNQVKRQDAEQKIKSGIYVTIGTKRRHRSSAYFWLMLLVVALWYQKVIPSQVADLVQDYFGISRDDFLNRKKHQLCCRYPFLAG